MPELNADDSGLTVKVVLFGPGNEVYLWWGHMAIVVEDAVRGTSRMYDWGTFSFETEHFFSNFVMGRLWYQCSVSSEPEWIYDYYRSENRSVSVYTLNLSAGAKRVIRDFTSHNALPENKNYLYHHFNDNCATRIRDIIDSAVDGQFKNIFGQAPGRLTIREHVRRHTYFNPFFDWFLNFVMGRGIDAPSTTWEEMFLPSEIIRNIENFSYIDANGNEKKLVSEKKVFFESVGRHPVLDNPPNITPFFLVFGIALGFVFFGLRIRSRTSNLWRITFGALVAVFGVTLGVSGSLLFFLEFFSNHDYMYKNINILFCNPLCLMLIPFGFSIAKGKTNIEKAQARLCIFATCAGCVMIFTMLLKCIPGLYQQNEVSYALILPSTLALGILPDAVLRIVQKLKTKPRQG